MQLFMPFLCNGYSVPILTLGTDTWNYTYTPQYMCYGMFRDSFTFALRCISTAEMGVLSAVRK
jgi:hypothetical protein